MRKICPHCGSVQPPEQIECSECGACINNELDTEACVNRIMYYEPERWTKFAAIALFVLAVVELIFVIIYKDTYNIAPIFFGMIGAAVSGVAFAFPCGFYRMLDRMHLLDRRYQYRDLTPYEDVDDPSPRSIHYMFIVFAVISLLSLAALIAFILFRRHFIIAPPQVIEHLSDIVYEIKY